MTPAQRNGLIWFAEREPVGWFDETAPGHRMRSTLQKKGWIKRLPIKDALVVKYVVTPEGREMMKS